MGLRAGSEKRKTIPYTMFIKRTKIFPKYFLKMIGGATFVFGGSTQNLLGVPLGVPLGLPIGGANGSPNGTPQKKKPRSGVPITAVSALKRERR